jgi:hypothetical protein
MSNIQRIHRQRRKEDAILAVQGILNDYLLVRSVMDEMTSSAANRQ